MDVQGDNIPLLPTSISDIFRSEEQYLAIKSSRDVRIKCLLAIIDDIVNIKTNKFRRKYYKDALKAIAELNKMSGDYAPDRKLSLTIDMTKSKLDEVKKQYEDY